MDWITLAVISALFSAAAAILQKKVLFDMDPLKFALINSLFALVLSVPFFLMINYATLRADSLAVLFLKSILNGLAFLYVMKSIKSMELSGALPLLAITPGFVAIFAFIFLGEKLGGFEAAGLLCLLAGTYILEMQVKEKKLLDPFKVFIRSERHHFILAALALFTVSAILDKYLLKQHKLPVNAFLAFQHLFFAVLFLAVYYVRELRIKRRGGSADFSLFNHGITKKLLLFCFVIAVITVGYRYTQIEATRLAASVALVLAIKRLSVLFATIIGGKIFHESNLLKKALATAIIVAGIFLLKG